MYTVLIPYYNGAEYIEKLVQSLGKTTKILVVNDESPDALPELPEHVEVVKIPKRGYFSGAVNFGAKIITERGDDVLILNQDTHFDGFRKTKKFIEEMCEQYDAFGEGIQGTHPAWPKGYVHGTFFYIKADAWEKVGPFNETLYPLWGSTCEWQLRASRKDMDVGVIQDIPGFIHERDHGHSTEVKAMNGFTTSVGDGIQHAISAEREKINEFLSTPPLVSVIITCKNYGRYLQDAINSLIGGRTSLGNMEPQTLQSFEIVIVDDASTDNSRQIIEGLVDLSKGIRAIYLDKGVGTAAANNAGVKASFGKYLAMLDADDMMRSNRLEKLYRKQLENPHAIVFDNMMTFGHGKELRPYDMPEYDFNEMLKKNGIHAGIFMPRQAWMECGGYPENFGDGRQDWAINVALGRFGWCGVKVTDRLYLYRREGQGRTTVNTTPAHAAYFRQKMQNTFPDVYGGNLPMACCGRRGRPNAEVLQARAVSRANSRMVGANDGLVLLRYNGANSGQTPWYGKVSKIKYSFSALRRESYVDRRDVDGLLDIMEGGRRLFSLVTQDAQLKVNAPDGMPSDA